MHSKNNINAIRLQFAKQVNFYIKQTYIDVQKLNSTSLEIFKIIIAMF